MIWNWVTIKKFSELSGYSEEAARQKIKKNQLPKELQNKTETEKRAKELLAFLKQKIIDRIQAEQRRVQRIAKRLLVKHL